ncbi:Prenylcysteine [Aspergillus sclerotialis]|uniref:Prenylcysteine n=1 Tax=Aspergillus sclerotialis TaxID=2070753 RepID=A0A3A2ZMH6_9EURO|nr:Prenylcysteine [Aspergillus sclerotialis]
MGFRLFSLYYIAALLFAPFSYADGQVPLRAASTESTPKRVAIIGAGAAGSSASYHLRKYSDSTDRPLNITVFERSPYIGGRSTTVNVFDNPAYPIELGASIFVSVNTHLVNASREFGLNVRSASHSRPRESEDTLGIWDGTRFVFILKDSYGWWNIARLLWRYGLAPIRTQSLMKRTVGSFLKMYDEPNFPFKDIGTAAVELGLLDLTSSPGETYLEKNGISDDFAREIIQASTRVNYGQNLGLIHGLESMVCMATDGAMSVEGGNWKIFDGMLRAARASVRLSNAVTSIDRNADGTLTLASVPADSEGDEEKNIFDDVVLAGPMQYSNIAFNTPLERKPEDIPFVTLHVTLFSSPHKLSPKPFDLNDGNKVPETILTTLPKGMNLGSNWDGVGPAGFWSISTLQTVTPPSSRSFPNTEENENENENQNHYVYKIFSPHRPTASFIAQLLDLNITTPSESWISDLPKNDISWYHEKTWNPYPFLYPRVTFDEPSLAAGIWYTGGIESFISTMETSALMGRDVASLMARSWEERL